MAAPADGSPRRHGGRRLTIRGLGPSDAGLALLLALALIYLIHEGRGNRFFYDEWTWILTRRSGASGIFDSYNQHLEILPSAIYQLMLHTIGLAHYHWFRLLAALGHLALVAATYVFAKRITGGLVALIPCIPLAFFGNGWEFILWGVNFGFTTSIALSIAAIAVLQRGRSPLLACALLTLGTLFTESAVLFAVGIAVELTLTDRNLKRAYVWLVPVVLYGIWWVFFYTPYLSEHDYGALPSFGTKLAAFAAGEFVGRGEKTGWVVLVAILAIVVYAVARRPETRAPIAGRIVTVLGFWALVTVGRAQLGDPGASRYVYEGGVLLLLVVIQALPNLANASHGLSTSARSLRSTATTTVALVIAAVATVFNVQAFAAGESGLNIGSRTEASELTALLLIRHHVDPGFVLDPHYSPQIIAGEYFPAAQDLHSTGAYSLTELAQQPESMRAAADDVLVRAGELTATAATASATPAAPNCRRLGAGGFGATDELVLPAGGLTLMGDPGHSAPINREPTEIRVARFATGFDDPPVAALRGRQHVTLSARPDASPRPWRVQVDADEPVLACPAS